MAGRIIKLLSLLGDLEVRSFGGGADFVAQQRGGWLRKAVGGVP